MNWEQVTQWLNTRSFMFKRFQRRCLDKVTYLTENAHPSPNSKLATLKSAAIFEQECSIFKMYSKRRGTAAWIQAVISLQLHRSNLRPTGKHSSGKAFSDWSPPMPFRTGSPPLPHSQHGGTPFDNSPQKHTVQQFCWINRGWTFSLVFLPDNNTKRRAIRVDSRIHAVPKLSKIFRLKTTSPLCLVIHLRFDHRWHKVKSIQLAASLTRYSPMKTSEQLLLLSVFWACAEHLQEKIYTFQSCSCNTSKKAFV